MTNEHQQPGDEHSDRFQKLREKAASAEERVMKKNIYKRGVFDSLVEVAKEVQGIADATHQDFKKVIEEAGIQDPATLLDRSMSHWDKMLAVSKIPAEEQLIANLRDQFQLQLTQSSEVFVPTDLLESVNSDGENKERQEGEDANRVGMAIETLLHMKLGDEKITMDDLVVKVGKIPENSWRTRPYWVIDITPHKIAVFVNNQYANRTFVLPYKSKPDLKALETYTKEHFKALADKPNSLIHHFVFVDEGQFKGELAASVQKVFEGQEMLKPYETYEEAKAAVQALEIKNGDEYTKRYKENPRLPSNPDKKYGDAFVNWGDFLGTGNISVDKKSAERSKEIYETYEEAKKAVQALGFRGEEEYRKRYKEDPRLPSTPSEKYRDTFVNWGDFLGTKNVSPTERSKAIYATYEEAKTAVQALAIKTQEEYYQRYKEDPRLPSNPNKQYDDVFISMSDFLGNGKSNYDRAKEVYQTYKEAKVAAQALGIKNAKEYQKRYKEDPQLPSNPEKKYGEDFISWIDFLGKGKTNFERAKEIYKTYDEAKAAAQALGLKSVSDYQARYKEDPRLPFNPRQQYKKAFINWLDFLGTQNFSPVERAQMFYQTYEEARTTAQALGFSTQEDYRERYKEDPRLPSAPDRIYGDQFLGWSDFLGIEKNHVERGKEAYLTYDEAKAAVQALGIKSWNDYHVRYKEDPRLLATPDRKYKDAFISWGDFLGTGKTNFDRAKEVYQTYDEAKAAVQALGIKTWNEYRERYKEDPRLPSTPSVKYGDAFINWLDYLGKK